MHYFIVIATMAFGILLAAISGKLPMDLQLWFVVWVIGSLSACVALKISVRAHQ